MLRRGDDAARYKQIARRVDGLEDLPAAKQVEVIEELGARSDGLRLADELDAGALDAVATTDTLDEAARLIDETDEAGTAINRLADADNVVAGPVLRRLDDLPASARTGAIRALDDGVPASRLDTSLARFDTLRLTDAQRQQYEALLGHADDQVRNSWLRQSGRAGLRTGAFRKALQRVDAVRSKGHRITRFLSAEEANRRLNFEEPPVTADIIVAAFRTEGEDVFARLHREDNQLGGFMVREEEIVGLSKSELEDKFSLLETPQFVSDVHVPDDHPVWVADTAANFGGDRGATQYILRGDDLPKTNFRNQRELPIG